MRNKSRSARGADEKESSRPRDDCDDPPLTPAAPLGGELAARFSWACRTRCPCLGILEVPAGSRPLQLSRVEADLSMQALPHPIDRLVRQQHDLFAADQAEPGVTGHCLVVLDC